MKPFGRETLVIAAIVVVAAAAIGFVGAASYDAFDDDPPTIAPPLDQPPDQRAPTGPTAGGGRVQPEVDADERPFGRAELDRVRDAALAIAGGGTVTEIDRSDDLGEAYEVEVVTDRGEIDIALDRNFERVPNLRYDD